MLYTTLHQDIWDACVELYRSHKPIDMITVSEQYKDMSKDNKGEPYYISGLVDGTNNC